MQHHAIPVEQRCAVLVEQTDWHCQSIVVLRFAAVHWLVTCSPKAEKMWNSGHCKRLLELQQKLEKPFLTLLRKIVPALDWRQSHI